MWSKLLTWLLLKDRTGCIDGGVFQEILMQSALQLTEEEANAMRVDADVRNNDEILYRAWLRVLTGRATEEEQAPAMMCLSTVGCVRQHCADVRERAYTVQSAHHCAQGHL